MAPFGLLAIDGFARVPRLLYGRTSLQACAIALNDQARAEQLRRLLGPSPGLVDWNSFTSLGPADLYLGQLAAFRGDPVAARTHLAAAEDLSRRIGARGHLARSLLARATLEPDLAITAAREAWELASTFGMPRLIAEAKSVLAAVAP